MTDDIVERPATKDIRFHERLMRLSDCIASDPNIDEDLWAVPLAALAEIERLRAVAAELEDVREERKRYFDSACEWAKERDELRAVITAWADAWDAADRGEERDDGVGVYKYAERQEVELRKAVGR